MVIAHIKRLHAHAMKPEHKSKWAFLFLSVCVVFILFYSFLFLPQFESLILQNSLLAARDFFFWMFLVLCLLYGVLSYFYYNPHHPEAPHTDEHRYAGGREYVHHMRKLEYKEADIVKHLQEHGWRPADIKEVMKE